MRLTWEIGPGYPDAVLRLRGELTLVNASLARQVVLKILADQPDVLLVDVSGLTVHDQITLTVFPALQRLAEDQDVSLMLVAPSAALLRLLNSSALVHTVPVFPTCEEALAARPASRRLTRLILPGPEAGEQARKLVESACDRWDLHDLHDVAALVVTELTANAVRHAGTDLTVTLRLRRRYLHLGVRDLDPHPPIRRLPDDAGGRGLLIVEGVTAALGFIPQPDGKVVWATLRVPAAR